MRRYMALQQQVSAESQQRSSTLASRQPLRHAASMEFGNHATMP